MSGRLLWKKYFKTDDSETEEKNSKNFRINLRINLELILELVTVIFLKVFWDFCWKKDK